MSDLAAEATGPSPLGGAVEERRECPGDFSPDSPGLETATTIEKKEIVKESSKRSETSPVPPGDHVIVKVRGESPCVGHCSGNQRPFT